MVEYSYIKSMGTINQNLILSFLEKTYTFTDNHFFKKNVCKYETAQEWGSDIINSLMVVFSESRDFCETTFKFWAYSLGASPEVIEVNLQRKVLKTMWVPELAFDVNHQFGTYTDEETIHSFLNEFSNEIGSPILKVLMKFAPYSELKSIIRCIGYTLSDTLYDAYTYQPLNQLVLLNYEEIEHERQNNTYWQDWIRARKQDQKT